MLFEKSLEVLTSLQKYPNLERAIEARELYQRYDEERVAACTISIMQKFSKLQEVKELKEHADVV